MTKQLYEGFKRPVYWNEYKSKTETKNLDNNPTRFLLDVSFQGINRLIVLDFNNTTEDVADNPINNTANRVERHNAENIFFQE